MPGLPERSGDERVSLIRPDEPVRVLGIETGNRCVRQRKVEMLEHAYGAALVQVMTHDEIDRDVVPVSAMLADRSWIVPEVEDGQLFRRARWRSRREHLARHHRIPNVKGMRFVVGFVTSM